MIPSWISLLALLMVGDASAAAFDYDACFASDAKLACFLPGQCAVSRRSDDRTKTIDLVKSSSFKRADTLGCYALVAFKRYGDDKWLVILLMTGTEPKKEISIQMGSRKLFGCKTEDATTVTVDSGSLKNEILTTFVRRTELLCKFTVWDGLRKLMQRTDELTLNLWNVNPIKFDLLPNEIALQVKNRGTCNPDSLRYHGEPTAEGETSIRPLVEFENVRCDPGAQLYAVQGGKRYEATIQCQGNSYKIAKTGGGTLTLQSTFACSAKNCTLCGDVTLLSGNGGTKPQWTAGKGDVCAKLTCTGDRIQVPGSNGTVAKPYCKEFATGDFRWTIEYNAKELPFTEAACKTSVKCNDVQPLHVIPSIAPINPWEPKIACDNYQLGVRASATSAWTLIDAVSCTPETGEWLKISRKMPRVKLLPTEEIKCLDDEEADAAAKEAKKQEISGNTTNVPLPASAGGLSTVAIVSIAFVAVSVVLLIAGFAFFAVRRRRQLQAEMGEVDAKPPTPPVTADSDKQFGQEVSFSGNRATPSLKTPQPDLTAPKLRMKQIPEASQLEDAVSVTAHPIPMKVDLHSGNTSDKSTPPPPSIPPASEVDASKKKVIDLLEQSVPSMTE